MRVALAAKWMSEFDTGVGVYTKELVRAMGGLPEGERPSITLVHRGAPQVTGIGEAHSRSFKGMPGPLWLVSQNRFLQKLASSVDLIHEPFLGVAGGLSVPTVVTIHDTIPLDHPEAAPASFRLYFRHTLPRVLESASAILTDSEYSAKNLRRHFSIPREKLYVIPLGVDHLPKAPSGAPGDDELPAGWKGYFLAVGTGPMKNLQATVDAFQEFVRQVGKGYFLVIVGRAPPWLSSRLKQDENLRGHIKFLERIPSKKLAILYRHAVAVVHPAIEEGFGLVPLEAMAQGTPAIVSDRASLPEVCGAAALYDRWEDHRQIVFHMIDMLDPEKRAKVVARGLERVELYSWHRTAKETLTAYADVLGTRIESVPELKARMAMPSMRA